MFVRNRLQAGDYAMIVPRGLNVAIQYSEKGAIQRVLKGYEHGEDISDSVLQPIILNNIVPNKVPLKNGTTWVLGVLYTSVTIHGEGLIPGCIESTMIETFPLNANQYAFYAYDVSSYAAKFNGAVQVRQWLTFAKFNTLPGVIVPYDVTESKFSNMIAKDLTKHGWKEYDISDLYVYRKGSGDRVSTGLSYMEVDSVATEVDQQGYWNTTLTGVTRKRIRCNYSVAKTNEIHKGCLVVSDEDDNIVGVIHGAAKRSYPDPTTCRTCGKIIPVSKSGRVRCNDTHCISVMYPGVCHLLHVLGLPQIPYTRYKEITADVGAVFCAADILDAPEFSDAEVAITLSDVLDAAVPATILPKTLSKQLCDACSHSAESLEYYINHTEKMIVDLGLDRAVYSKFTEWLSSPENIHDIVNLLHNTHIQVCKKSMRFDGAPMFRGKTVMITGTFKRGIHAEIADILSSYAATVVTELTPSVDCVVIGDIPEGVNGSAVIAARRSGLPVYEESTFFTMYDIDKDLAENL